MKKNSIILLLMLLSISLESVAQITERKRPEEWNKLVLGGRFIDRFMPMHDGKITSDTWGGNNVKPRIVDNGIENNEMSFWGGNILFSEKDKLYHMYVCGWPEKSPAGHFTWPRSTVFHAVCDNSNGPFEIKDTIGPGHNPEAFMLDDGRTVVYVIDSYYISDSLGGSWQKRTFDFDPNGHEVIDGLSNLSFARRKDGSRLMVSRGGGIWISKDGLSTYVQLTDKSVYPNVEGCFEDPVLWRDSVQYNLIVNDWYGRIAYYLRSKDGIKWVVDPGEAYSTGIAKHLDETKEDWFKFERMKIFQDPQGRAVQANFAVIDTLKGEDKGNDIHSSKNISIPLNPGIIIKVLDKKDIASKGGVIRLLVKSESNFDPKKEIDFESLRFGSSQRVNYGKGGKVIKYKNKGKDIILYFKLDKDDIIEDEFVLKLLGLKKNGEMLFGFCRLPWVNYDELSFNELLDKK